MAEAEQVAPATGERPGLLKHAPKPTKPKPNIQTAYALRGQAYRPHQSAYERNK